MVGVIRKTFCSIPIDTFLSLYNTLVRPHLEYDNVIWGPLYMLDQNRIENVHAESSYQTVTGPIYQTSYLRLNKDSRNLNCQLLNIDASGVT